MQDFQAMTYDANAEAWGLVDQVHMVWGLQNDLDLGIQEVEPRIPLSANETALLLLQLAGTVECALQMLDGLDAVPLTYDEARQQLSGIAASLRFRV